MKRTLNTLFAAAILASLLGLLIIPKRGVPVALAQNRTHEACSVATLRGDYGFTTPTGFSRPDPDSPGFVPDVAAGLVTFDGAGNFTGKASDVTNGDTAPETPPFQFALVGTYTLDSDCTGSLTEINSGTHLEIVAVASGREIFAIQTDAQETRTLEFKKIRNDE